jgi:hypothetical protein
MLKIFRARLWCLCCRSQVFASHVALLTSEFCMLQSLAVPHCAAPCCLKRLKGLNAALLHTSKDTRKTSGVLNGWCTIVDGCDELETQ